MKVAVIGAGNMGGALIHGWAKSGKVESLTIADKNEALLDKFKKTYPGRDIMDLYNMDRSTRAGTVEFADAMAGFGNKVWNYMITYQLDYFGGMPSYHGICPPLVFGNTEYVTGIRENTRTKSINYVFKRRK